MLLQGLFVPLTCPFYRDGASYLRKLEHNVGRYTLGPAAGLVALPPGGESKALTDAEAEEFFQAVGASTGKSKVLLAGVERASVRAACAMAEAAERSGFDAIVLAPPTDWARLFRGQDARELLLFYESVADRAALPVLLWSDARPPYFQLPIDVINRLARHRNVIGLLDADLSTERCAALLTGTKEIRREATVTMVFEAVTRRMLQAAAAPAAELQGIIAVEALSGGTAVASAASTNVRSAPALKTRTREVGFQILSAGAADGMVRMLRAGVAGAMPPLAACAPQACFEAYAAWKDGDQGLADERASRLGVAEELAARYGPAALKAGCDFNGYFGGGPRLPRLPLTAEARVEVETSLLAIRN